RGDVAELDVLGHGDHPKLEQFAGFGADDGAAENGAIRPGNDLDEAFGFALALGAIIVGIRPTIDADAAIALACLCLGHANLGELGGGVNDPRDIDGARIWLQPEKRVPDHDTGVIVGKMGELRAADHVADSVDATVSGLELLVHLDAVVRVGDASALEAERLEVRLAAGGDEEMRSVEDDWLAILH